VHWTFGAIQHVQICSPDLEQRIRVRYHSEIRELAGIGFDFMFLDGETFSLFRLPLLIPVIAVLGAMSNKEVITIHDGTKYLSGFPVFMSKSKTTWAHPIGLGVKFYTAFQDGTILVSKTFADDTVYGPTIVLQARNASISDTWADHQKRIEVFEVEGKRIDRQTSFQAYAQISHEETAAW
jgi:hypothetical protein